MVDGDGKRCEGCVADVDAEDGCAWGGGEGCWVLYQVVRGETEGREVIEMICSFVLLDQVYCN